MRIIKGGVLINNQIMKIVITCFCLILSLTIESQNYKVMTYNIRLDIASDGENSWSYRKEKVVDLILFYEPDIFGIQEGLPNQVQYLDSSLHSYKAIGQGRDGGLVGEQSSIFYNDNRFEIMESDTFWLSETPEKVSKGWDAQLNRICTYALFKNKKTDQHFWVFNTHLDHIGQQSRVKSVTLINEIIELKNSKNYPVVFMGDLNSEPTSEQVQFLNERYLNSKHAAKFVYNPTGTFNGFEFQKPVTTEIDYIFLSKKGVVVKKYAVITDSNNCKYPSDHFPIYVEFELVN